MWHEIIIFRVEMRCTIYKRHARINESSKYFCSEGVFNKERKRGNPCIET